MSQLLLMALAASVPLAVLAFAAAWIVEAMDADVKLRLCAWTAALALPVLPLAAMPAIHLLGIASPFAPPQATVQEAAPAMTPVPPAAIAASRPRPPALPLVPLTLGLIGAGAVVRLGQFGLGLRRVARLKAASLPIADPDMAARLGRGVRLADTAAPILAGLIHPTILLPRRWAASRPSRPSSSAPTSAPTSPPAITSRT